MLKIFAILILLLMQVAHSAFLVGQDAGKITVLCEGQQAVFVSVPSGAVLRLALDADFEAGMATEAAGIYSIQCGREAKSVAVAGAAAAARTETYDALGAAFVAFLILSFLAATLLLGWLFIRGRTEFSKTVEGGRATLLIRAGRKMEGLAVSDPVSFDYRGREMRFAIPALEAGREWKFEYELDASSTALPAGLEAECEGKKISMLSELRIGGEALAVPKAERGKKPAGKRRLARAGG